MSNEQRKRQWELEKYFLFNLEVEYGKQTDANTKTDICHS
jgi:hypothetical protein